MWVLFVLQMAQFAVVSRSSGAPQIHSCSRLFQCQDKSQCIPVDHVCNNLVDCDDASDEINDCYTLCYNRTCSFGCIPSQSGVECACSQESASASALVDPCDDLERTPILYSTRSAIWSFELHARKRPFLVLTDLNFVHDIDLDVRGQRIFWTDPGEKKVYVLRFGPSGSQSKQVVVDIGLQNPRGLAFEWYTQQLYIVDSMLGAIVACHDDGSVCSVVVGELEERRPEDIVVDPVSRRMFWTELNHPVQIMSSDLDGSNPAVFVENLRDSGCMVIDMTTRHLYFVDTGHSTVHVVDLDDNKSGEFVLVLASPSAVTIAPNALVWFEQENGDIKSAKKLDGEEERVLFHFNDPIHVTSARTLHQSSQPPGENPCINAPCSKQCLQSNLKNGYTCACPPEMILGSDGRNCAWSPDFPFLFVASSQEILQIPLNNIGMLTFRRLNTPTMKDVGTLDYNPLTRDLFFSSPREGHTAIYRLSDVYKRKFKVELIEEHPDYLGSGYNLIVDYIANSIFWLDEELNVIKVFRVDGTARSQIVLNGTDHAISIAADFTLGFLYYSHWGNEAQIMKCHMDSTNCMVLVKDADKSHHLSLHGGRIYWTNLDYAEISSASAMDGSNIMHHHWSNRPQGFVVYGEMLYYTDATSNAIHIFDMASEMNVTDYNLPHYKINDLIIQEDLPRLQNFPCQQSNGGCSHICLSMPEKQRRCLCPANMQISDDNQTCIAKENPCLQDFIFCESTQRCYLHLDLCTGRQKCQSLVLSEICRVPKTTTTPVEINPELTRDCSSAEEAMCGQHCTKTNDGPICSCDEGYMLLSDGHTCRDVNECAYRNGNCSQLCTNSKGSYSCSCVEGYRLIGDKATCLAEDRAGAYLLVQYRHSLRHVSMDGESEHIVFNVTQGDPSVEHTIIFDVLIETQDILWVTRKTQASTIHRYQYGRTTDFRKDDGVVSLCFDWITGNVYYMTVKDNCPVPMKDTQERSCAGRLVVCDGTGRFCKDLKSEQNWLPWSLVIHPKRRLIFWIELLRNTLDRAFMDGSGVQTILSNMDGPVDCLTIDRVTERLFWVRRNFIETVNWDGTDRYTLLISFSVFTSVATFEGFLYLTTTEESIQKASSFSERPVLAEIHSRRALTSILRQYQYTTDRPTSVRVVHPLAQPAMSDPCVEKSCKFLCVLGETDARCLCPDDDLAEDCTDGGADSATSPKASTPAFHFHIPTVRPRPRPTLQPAAPTSSHPDLSVFPATRRTPAPRSKQQSRPSRPVPMRPQVFNQNTIQKRTHTPRPVLPTGNSVEQQRSTAPAPAPAPCVGVCKDGLVCVLRDGIPVCSKKPDVTTVASTAEDNGANVGLVAGLLVLGLVLVVAGFGVYRFCRTRRVATDLISRITYRNPNFKQNADEGVVLVSDQSLYKCAFAEDDEDDNFYKKGKCWKSSSSSAGSTDSAISSHGNSPKIIYRPVIPPSGSDG